MSVYNRYDNESFPFYCSMSTVWTGFILLFLLVGRPAIWVWMAAVIEVLGIPVFYGVWYRLRCERGSGTFDDERFALRSRNEYLSVRQARLLCIGWPALMVFVTLRLVGRSISGVLNIAFTFAEPRPAKSMPTPSVDPYLAAAQHEVERLAPGDIQ